MGIWEGLAVNFAVVGFFFAMWGQIVDRFSEWRSVPRRLAFGIWLAIAVSCSMGLAIPVSPGIYFDLRVPIIALASYFGGPIAGLPPLILAVLVRLLSGGTGAPAGVLSVVLAFGCGLAFRHATGRLLASQARRIFGLSLSTVATTAICIALLPVHETGFAWLHMALPNVVLGFLGTLVFGYAMAQLRKARHDRVLLMAALRQAPDFFYVKDPEGQFVLANERVIHHHGLTDEKQIIGLTDKDLTTPARAAALLADERNIVETGVALLDLEEEVEHEGQIRTYSTTKVPLRNWSGRVIGIAGLSKDITDRRVMEREMAASRDLFATIAHEMSDALVYFDEKGTLVYCNDHYRSLFPRTAKWRHPGSNLRDILRATAETGEQRDLPADIDGWIEAAVQKLGTASDRQIQLDDGRWMLVRQRPTQGGSTVSVISDITEIKRSELGLRSMAEHMKVLAGQDGLTGLVNRRSLDEELDLACAASEATRSAIGLVMVDVDFFKPYNDIYGHPAGDECLKIISQILRMALRPGDTAARYGGEEFALILPAGGAGYALQVSLQVQTALAATKLHHSAGIGGLVTVSIGIADFAEDARGRLPQTLVSRADDALYAAKKNGRNRVVVWSEGDTEQRRIPLGSSSTLVQ